MRVNIYIQHAYTYNHYEIAQIYRCIPLPPCPPCVSIYTYNMHIQIITMKCTDAYRCHLAHRYRHPHHTHQLESFHQEMESQVQTSPICRLVVQQIISRCILIVLLIRHLFNLIEHAFICLWVKPLGNAVPSSNFPNLRKTHFEVWHKSFSSSTSVLHRYDMTHPHVIIHSHLCNMTHSYVCQTSFTNTTCHIHTCAVSRAATSNPRTPAVSPRLIFGSVHHDSCICVHDSFICATRRIHKYDAVWWVLTRSHVQHDTTRYGGSTLVHMCTIIGDCVTNTKVEFENCDTLNEYSHLTYDSINIGNVDDDTSSEYYEFYYLRFANSIISISRTKIATTRRPLNSSHLYAVDSCTRATLLIHMCNVTFQTCAMVLCLFTCTHSLSLSHTHTHTNTHTYTRTQTHTSNHTQATSSRSFDIIGPRLLLGIGWLRLVGSLKLLVSFAKEPYKRDDILQKKPIILRSLLIVGTSYCDSRFIHIGRRMMTTMYTLDALYYIL